MIKFSSENPLAIKMKKSQIQIKKSVCLGLPILELSKNVMYEFWYDYIKPKHVVKPNVCYMDTRVSLCT